MRKTLRYDFKIDDWNRVDVWIDFDDRVITIRAAYYQMDYGTGNRIGRYVTSEKYATVPVDGCQSIEELRKKVIRAASYTASRNISGPALPNEYFERYKQIIDDTNI